MAKVQPTPIGRLPRPYTTFLFILDTEGVRAARIVSTCQRFPWAGPRDDQYCWALFMKLAAAFATRRPYVTTTEGMLSPTTELKSTPGTDGCGSVVFLLLSHFTHPQEYTPPLHPPP